MQQALLRLGLRAQSPVARPIRQVAGALPSLGLRGHAGGVTGALPDDFPRRLPQPAVRCRSGVRARVPVLGWTLRRALLARLQRPQNISVAGVLERWLDPWQECLRPFCGASCARASIYAYRACSIPTRCAANADRGSPDTLPAKLDIGSITARRSGAEARLKQRADCSAKPMRHPKSRFSHMLEFVTCS